MAPGHRRLGRGVAEETGHTLGGLLWMVGVGGMSSRCPGVGVCSRFLHSSLDSLQVGFVGNSGYRLSSVLDSERKVEIPSVSSEQNQRPESET